MNVHITRWRALFLASLLTGIAAAPADADQARDLNWSGAVPASATFAVNGINGQPRGARHFEAR